MKRAFSWVIDHPWVTIVAVLLVTAGFLAALPRLVVNTDFESYIDHDDPAYVAAERAEARFGSSDVLMIALVEPGGVYTAEVLGVVEALTRELEALPGVDEVQSPLNTQIIEATADSLTVGPAAPDEAAPTTPDEIAAFRDRVMSNDVLADVLVARGGEAINLIVTYTDDADNARLTRQITDTIDAYRDRYTFYLSGMHFMSQSLSESMAGDLAVLLPIVLFVIAAVLYASFRSLRGVFIPLAVVALSLVWAFGLISLTGMAVTAISFILPILLLAVGIAYGIHILSHVNERTAAGDEKRTAIRHAMDQIHAPVVMTGLTTVAGFMALLTSFMPVIAEFGFAAGIGVAIAMILSLVLIPALLAVLPTPKARRRRRPAATGEGMMARVLRAYGGFIGRHSRRVLVISLVVLAAFAAGIPFIAIDSSTSAFLGDEHPAVEGMNVMEAYFSGSERVVIEIDTGRRDGLKEPAVLEEMLALETYLEEIGVRKTLSMTDLVRELHRKFRGDDEAYETIPEDRRLVSQLLLLFSFQGGDLGSLTLGDYSAGEIIGFYPKMNSDDLATLVTSIETYLETELADGLHGEMVGSTRLQQRMTTQLVASQLISLATSVVIAAAIVALLMGSLVAGLIAALPLVFAIVMTFGTMGIAGMTLNIATAMISSITIGIGIDYAIHFISRYRAEIRAGRGARDAIAETASTSGQAIVHNALAVIAGFIVLLFSVFSAFKSFGGLISLSMAVSALSALTVIPAIFVQWQPRFLTDELSWRERCKRLAARQSRDDRDPEETRQEVR